MKIERTPPTPVTPVTSDGSVTQLSSDVTDMTGVTVGGPREPNARVKGRNTLIHAKNKKGSVRSQPVTPVTPPQACDRCIADETAPPCGSCPLHGAWLERIGLTGDGSWRAVYAVWVGAGGWTASWAAGKARKRAVKAEEIREVLERFPRVRERWPNYPSVAGAR